MDGCRRTVQGDGGGALFVVDVEQDEAKQDSQHPGKDKAGAVVGHIPQVALPESAGTTHQHSLTHSPNTAMKSAWKHTRGTIWCRLDRTNEESTGGGEKSALPKDEPELGEGVLRVFGLKVQRLVAWWGNAQLLDQGLIMPAAAKQQPSGHCL